MRLYQGDCFLDKAGVFVGSSIVEPPVFLSFLRVYHVYMCVFSSFFLFLFLIQYNKYNTIIQHISAPVPTVDNTRIQIYMLMLYIHNRQKRYIHTDIHTDKELDKVLHRQIFALHKA